ncbi:MAG: UDP-N-acetylglucosamine 2-epimerase (hydrolyzing), partial [Gammaproteobacteria bacterium]|nr:UDP-N-acetylglucosamine 2-epimerase (hydrolyzing) [Gammaproteobacteria bacterium]
GSRQAGRDRGKNVRDVDYDRTAISAAIQACRREGRLQADFIYGQGGAGTRIADALATIKLSVEKRLPY